MRGFFTFASFLAFGFILRLASSLSRWCFLSPPCQRLVQIPWLRGRGHPRYLAQAFRLGLGTEFTRATTGVELWGTT